MEEVVELAVIDMVLSILDVTDVILVITVRVGAYFKVGIY